MVKETRVVFLFSFLVELRRSGFMVSLEGDLVSIYPSERLAKGQLDHLKANKRYIVKELELERRN
jgi:hypothetical protein